MQKNIAFNLRVVYILTYFKRFLNENRVLQQSHLRIIGLGFFEAEKTGGGGGGRIPPPLDNFKTINSYVIKIGRNVPCHKINKMTSYFFDDVINFSVTSQNPSFWC